MTTPIYPLNITITPTPSRSPPTFALSLPETLSPAQTNTLLSGALRPTFPTGETESLEPIPVYIRPPPSLPSPGLGPSTTTSTTYQQPTKRLLHLNPSLDVLLLLNLPAILSSYPSTPLTSLLPSLSKFRRIAVPFDPLLTPESLLSIWPDHFPQLDDIYVVVDTSLHPEVLRRDARYKTDTIEEFVCLEGRCFDVHGDAEDRAWVVKRGRGTADGVVKGLNELIYEKEMMSGMGRTGGYQSPRVGVLGLVRG
ncbi:hypothetical protein QBC40DRAFT_296296 [Triangularia verruculosa]|uniref:Uncharacterized protein n=1 Tax=Triangularia verruculosa TaxID=2587418 RepID=A0AAN6XN15_9PEZI|nr:hypothetical protein QBC40DRAFT_296296 [Triangularia verruculosa]